MNAAQCFPPDGCLHDGHCAIPGTCYCASGWTGRKCEIRRCIPNYFESRCVQLSLVPRPKTAWE